MVECWYRNKCTSKYNHCTRSCVRYNEMYELFSQSNLPMGKWGKMELKTTVDTQAFHRLNDIKKDIVNYIKDGNNLYIYSPICGNGKTSWAIKLMQAYFSKIWAGNRFRRRAIFFSVPEFIDREHMRMNQQGEESEEFVELRQAITECDLVVWDDIGSIKTTDYTHLLLLNFISHRQVNGKANIFTGNLNGDFLNKQCGSRLASRIWNASEIIAFQGQDMRGAKLNG